MTSLSEDAIFRHFQKGNGDPYFKGYVLPQVRGRGLGSFLSTIVRKALPVVKRVVMPAVKRHVVPQAKRFAIDTAKDVLSGENVKNSLKRRSRIAGENILGSALGGNRRKRKASSRKVSKYIKRRKTKDIFA